MYTNDLAFIYKQKRELLFGITKDNGKIIIKNNKFYSKYSEFKTFYLVQYEYEKEVLEKISYSGSVFLKTSSLEIEEVVPLVSIKDTMHMYISLFDQHVLYKGETCEIFLFLYNFFFFDSSKKNYGKAAQGNLLAEILFFLELITTEEYKTKKNIYNIIEKRFLK